MIDSDAVDRVFASALAQSLAEGATIYSAPGCPAETFVTVLSGHNHSNAWTWIMEEAKRCSRLS